MEPLLDYTLIEAAFNSKATAEDWNEDYNDNNSGSSGQPQLMELAANEKSGVEVDKDFKWIKKVNNLYLGIRNLLLFMQLIAILNMLKL